MAKRYRKNSQNGAAVLAVIMVLTIAALGVLLLRSLQTGKDRRTEILTMPTKSVAFVKPTPAPTSTPKPVTLDKKVPSGDAITIREVPVYWHKDTTEKIICITVDDCNEAKNLSAILDVCEKNKARITVLPIGENLQYQAVADQIRRAYKMGMEIENHTWSHARLYELDEQGMADEIYNEQVMVSKTLGVKYSFHFLRTRGGDNRNDPRTQSYIASLGYYGMAHWETVGSQSTQEQIRAALKPGTIYLFHTLDADAENLKQFIPWAIKQGYKLVTLNQMFGFPDNETAPLPEKGDKWYTAAYPGRYEIGNYQTLKLETYTRDVYLLQERLLELGYLQYEKPTGYYGQMTADAVYYFQVQHKLTADGEAGSRTQSMLYSSSAQEISKDTISRWEREKGIKYKDYRR